ncbi:MAG: hypothetical protein ACLPQI_01930 [Steroidobacteraceae bacterium]
MSECFQIANDVAYLRVSTERQGKSGFGLEAQQSAVEAFIEIGCVATPISYRATEAVRRVEAPPSACSFADPR